MSAETNQMSLREHILEEAAQLFTKRGYQGVSMREIAEAVGVSKAGLYYHFKDKEALFLGVLLSSIETLGQLVEEARALDTLYQQLETLLMGIATRVAGQQQIMRLAEQDAVHLSPEAHEQIHKAYHGAFIGQIQRLLKEAQGRGEVRALETTQLTWILLGMARPLLSAPPDKAEAAVGLVLSVFFEGITSRETPRTVANAV